MLIFSDGINEMAPPIRACISAGLGFLGTELDSSLNETNTEVISSKSSQVSVRIIHTNE